MKKVFVSQNLVEIEMLKERLERAGIPCTIKNQYSSSLSGEVPFTEVFPELWVVRDIDNDQALELIEEPSASIYPARTAGPVLHVESITMASLGLAGSAAENGAQIPKPRTPLLQILTHRIHCR